MLENAGLILRRTDGTRRPCRLNPAAFDEVDAFLTRPHRILHVERLFLPDQTPDNQVQTTCTPQNNGTLMTMRMSLPDAATRTAMMANGMTDGMSMCYDLLETLV